MRTHLFQFRECLNPECGLRYPLAQPNEFGERCPLCLGATRSVAENVADHELPSATSPVVASAAPWALLDNVRSALNVGSIFRTAEGYGFAHLYLCGITPTPDNPQVAKTALGAQTAVDWSAHKNAVTLIPKLRARGYQIWVLERTEGSRALDTRIHRDKSGQRRILVVGNEQAGVDPGILELADEVVHLEMRGVKQSFNVAIAFAIAAHVIASSGQRNDRKQTG